MTTEVTSQASLSYQDEIWVERYTQDSPEFVQIFGVTEVKPPEKTPDDIDTTHQQSPGQSKESMPGLMDSADWSSDLQFWPNHASQQMLDDLATLTETGAFEYVYVEFKVGGLRRTYRGYVKSFTPQGSVGEKRAVTLSMKIFNRLTENPRVVTEA